MIHLFIVFSSVDLGIHLDVLDQALFYVPRTQMTIVLLEKGLVLEG